MIEKKYWNTAILILSILVLSFPIILRFSTGDPIMTGQESYDLINEYRENLKENDANLVFIIIKIFENAFGEKIDLLYVILTLNCLLLIGSLFFIHSNFKREYKKNYFILFSVLLLSPTISYLLITFNTLIYAIFFINLSIYFYINKFKKMSIFVLMLVSLVDLYLFIISVIALYLFLFRKSKDRNGIWLLTFSAIISLVLLFSNSYLWNPKFQNPAVTSTLLDFGSYAGLTIPILIFYFISIIFLWKKNLIIDNILFLMLLVLSFFEITIAIICSLFFAYRSGFAILGLIRRRWTAKFLKSISLLLIFCLLLFSSVSYANTMKDREPKNELFQSIKNFENCCSDGEILTHEKYNRYFYYLSLRNTFLKEETATREFSNNGRKLDSYKIFSSRILIEAKPLLDKNNIKYIFITKEMSDGLIWEAENEGFQFLLKNSNSFKQIYSYSFEDENYNIWQYSG